MWISPCAKVYLRLCGFTQSAAFFHVRKLTVQCEFSHVEKCISACGYTQGAVYFRISKFTLLCDFSPCGKVYLRLRIYARYSELPHAEIHHLMWIPSWGKVYCLMRIYTRKCEFPKTRKFTKNLIFRICGYTLIIVNFHLWKCTRKCVYPLCGFTQILVYIPHAEIHSLMWIPTWGKVYFRGCGFAQF